MHPARHLPHGQTPTLQPLLPLFRPHKASGPGSCTGTLQPISMEPLTLDRRSTGSQSLLKLAIQELQRRLASSGPDMIHRFVIPSLLSPSIYPPECSRPSEVLQFLHALRALLRQYSTQLTALITLPITLFPRGTGLTRWVELLCDGVIELIPLPSQPGGEKPDSENSDQGQGLLRVHSLPIYHEKGGGGAENYIFPRGPSFNLSGSKGLVIKPYSLPPLGEESQKEKSPASTVKDGIDF